MRKLIILFLFVCCLSDVSAQTSRRAINKYASEAVRQIALTGRTPTIDILDTLANNAEVSVEMLSRMGDPDDERQQRACLKLIDDIVAYSMKPTGLKYTDIVRAGLKKALDRSYEPEVQLHVMEQLALCAKPADAEHIAMYLEVERLAPTARRILVAMPGIDDRLAAISGASPDVARQIRSIVAERDGKRQQPANVATTPKPEPIVLPLWTESIDREVERLRGEPSAEADSIVIMLSPRLALPKLLALAGLLDGAKRAAVVARAISVAERAAANGDMTNEELYLILRSADDVNTDPVLSEKIIVALGNTHTIQAFVYLKRYCMRAEHADAMAIAITELVSALPQINSGRLVYSMLYAAKQSFIRHYDEQGMDSYIDQALAAIDKWHADGGYNLAHTEETRMEKRGFWIIHDDLADFDLAFDWKAKGTLSLSLRSLPALSISAEKGVQLCGSDASWQRFDAAADWNTAHISVRGNRISVAVNGHVVIDGKQISSVSGKAAQSGYVKFTADDLGATVRQYCFRRQ